MFCPNACTCQIEGKAVVTYVSEGSEAYAKGLRPGAVITRIDGLSVAEKDRATSPGTAGVFVGAPSFWQWRTSASSAWREGSKVKVTFLPPGHEEAVEIELQRTATMPSADSLGNTAPCKFPVEKGKFVWSGTHPSGYGYIRIVSFKGREEDRR